MSAAHWPNRLTAFFGFLGILFKRLIVLEHFLLKRNLLLGLVSGNENSAGHAKTAILKITSGIYFFTYSLDSSYTRQCSFDFPFEGKFEKSTYISAPFFSTFCFAELTDLASKWLVQCNCGRGCLTRWLPRESCAFYTGYPVLGKIHRKNDEFRVAILTRRVFLNIFIRHRVPYAL